MQDTPDTEIDKASWIWLTLRDEYIDCRPVRTDLDGWYPEAPASVHRRATSYATLKRARLSGSPSTRWSRGALTTPSPMC